MGLATITVILNSVTLAVRSSILLAALPSSMLSSTAAAAAFAVLLTVPSVAPFPSATSTVFNLFWCLTRWPPIESRNVASLRMAIFVRFDAEGDLVTNLQITDLCLVDEHIP